ncbi:MAG: mannose-1-phosphate guanylyltransferase [Deltaproteobacteria bacterium]|nr:mannose-1-phosphate guanylyltransferase [Deltaproteobacteria bacterium]MBI3061009.1 mannose-1-phosphate guanylyltransferase [Deltaproteobacteria bacterium]
MIKALDMERHAYAAIIAGGKGTRFWPLSRPQHPKQLLKILSGKSLIRETVDRTAPLFGSRNTLVVTVAEHYHAVRREIPVLAERNFIVEPQGNNTAPCIGLAALEVAARDPDAVMAILPADHWVSDPGSLSRALRDAIRLARAGDSLVTIGIRPSYPETGYGYILKGKQFKGPGGVPCYRVKGFKEKPTRRRAAHLVRRGSLWNSGMFVWRASTILEMLRRFSPPIARSLERIRAAMRDKGLANPSASLRAVVRREYRKMPNISIDYAVLEKAGAAGRLLALEGRFGWSDVGSWAAAHRMLPHDGKGNVGLGKWLGFKSKDCFVYSRDRLVALLGVQGLVVVDTADALLIAAMERSQEVRELVEELKRRGYGRYTVR